MKNILLILLTLLLVMASIRIASEGWRTGWKIKQANERADTAMGLLVAHTNRPPIPWVVFLTLDEARELERKAK